VVKAYAGRLERLIHRSLAEYAHPVGSFREYFSDERLAWLLDELESIHTNKYQLPEEDGAESHLSPIAKPGRKKSRLELLAEYSDIVSRLEASGGIREISRDIRHGVNTVRKVKQAFEER
jgi:hypothetical protein